VLTATLTIPRDRFSRIRGGLSNPAPALEAVGHWVANKWMPGAGGPFMTGGLGTWPAVLRGGKPLVDQGTLMRSFMWSLGSGGRSVLIVTPMKYAAMQNFGGTVTPKAGKFLAIPLPTLSPTERKSKPRDFQNTFFSKSRKGNLILFEKTGKKKDAIRPLFVMKSSVTIKPRPFMKWFPEMKAQATAIAKATILKAMGEKAA
jgi:phage gpG-like protein